MAKRNPLTVARLLASIMAAGSPLIPVPVSADWSRETVVPVAVRDTSASVSLAMQPGSAGDAAIVIAGNHLVYATFDGVEWVLETLETVDRFGCETASPSLALDGDGRPAIAYSELNTLTVVKAASGLRLLY